MGVGGDFYNFLLVLHIIAVVVGFGGVALAPAYGLQARDRPGREGLAIAEALYNVMTKVAEWFIYAVPVLGILLILTSEDAWEFSQAWISLSLLIYIAAIAVVHALHLPNIRRMNALMTELVGGGAGPPAGGGPPPQAAELELRGKKAAMLGGILNLSWVAIICLMVWKPGL